MRITRLQLRKMIAEALNEVSPAWREDPSRRFDVEATPVNHGHYGALNPDKRSPAEVEASVNLDAEEEFKQYAINEFDRIFKTDFYKNKLASAGGQFDFIADDTVTRALSGDIMHGLLHEMLQRYIFEIFKEKRMEQPEYDLWTNIMETIVYYLQNGLKGTNPRPFGRWITERMSETIDMPAEVDGDKLYDMFTQVFTSGTADRPGHNQIEEIPAKLREPFLRDIQKALRKKGAVKPVEVFAQAVGFFINDIHKGGNAKTFLYDADGNDISDQVMSFYNVLKRKVDQLKKKYPAAANESAETLLRQIVRESLLDTVKGAFTGANKLVDALYKMIDKNFSLKNAMYEDYLVKRSKPESAIKSHMATFRKKFDELFAAVGISEEQKPEVEKLLIPKLIELMKEMDKTRISRS